jgi:hypothetical protein
MDDEQPAAAPDTPSARHATLRAQAALDWLDRVDPGTHRRIKGLRLVTAYGLAAALGALQDVTRGVPAGASVGALAASFAL